MAKKEAHVGSKRMPKKQNVRETSFGSAPESMELSKGTMHKFGYRAVPEGHKSVFFTRPISVDVKTNYPEGFDKK